MSNSKGYIRVYKTPLQKQKQFKMNKIKFQKEIKKIFKKKLKSLSKRNYIHCQNTLTFQNNLESDICYYSVAISPPAESSMFKSHIV